LKVEGFKGIKSLFVITTVDEAATRCSVHKEDLETAFKFVIAQSSLNFATNLLQSDAALHLSVSGLNNQSCILLLQAHVVSKLLRRFDRKPILAAIAWEGALFANADGQKVASMVEVITKRLVVQWIEANK